MSDDAERKMKWARDLRERIIREENLEAFGELWDKMIEESEEEFRERWKTEQFEPWVAETELRIQRSEGL